MSLQHDIHEGIKDALKARDEVRTSVLRGLSAAFVNELVATRRKPTEELSDDQAIAVIKREAKKHKESIELFQKGKRQDLVDKESAELAIIETFLPAMMSTEEIRAAAEKKKAELGVTDPKEKGKLIGALMKELGGRADGSEVKAAVDALF